MERSFDRRLSVYLRTLVAEVAAPEEGGERQPQSLGEPLFELPLSGWYWQITRTDSEKAETRASRSLWDKKLPKLEALRRAQIYVLRSPAAVEKRRRELNDTLAARGFGKASEALPDGGKVEAGRSPPAWWAAFVAAWLTPFAFLGGLLRRRISVLVDELHASRARIVEGAVGMVRSALERLAEEDVVDLDEERKATMVSNLLVVLCGDRDAQPVVNTGSLYQ